MAENSKHRVCRYDREGKQIGNWGYRRSHRHRRLWQLLQPDERRVRAGRTWSTRPKTTRAASSDIRQEGELLGLVGSVDLVPGCKNCSIAVSDDGSRVYMLDITRGHIVRDGAAAMPGEAGPAAVDESEPLKAQTIRESPRQMRSRRRRVSS